MAINADQRVLYLSLGDLAVQMGLMNFGELNRVLARQRDQRLCLGEALARLGLIEWDRLGALLDAYKADQARYEAGRRCLPDVLERALVPGFTIEWFPEFLMRFDQTRGKCGDVTSSSADTCQADVKGSVCLSGPSLLAITLASGREFPGAPTAAASQTRSHRLRGRSRRGLDRRAGRGDRLGSAVLRDPLMSIRRAARMVRSAT